MTHAFAALVLVALGQVQSAPAEDARVKSIAPFVQSDVFAVIQVDIGKLDVERLSARVFGAPPGIVEDGKKMVQELAEGLKGAGAKELYVVFSVIDMPGQPFLVVPLSEGAQAEGIARAIHGEPAPIHNAIVGGSPARPPESRARRPAPAGTFGGVRSGWPGVGLGAITRPSLAESRRVLEETLPRFPEELGGGEVTDLTRGLLWAAAGIDDADKPALKLIAGSRDGERAQSLVQLMEKIIGFARRSPEIEHSVPGLAKVLPVFRPVVDGNRVTLQIEAQQVGAILDVVMGTAGEAAARAECTNNGKHIVLALHNYHQQHNSFPPAFSQTKDGKPLLSWRVLILPFLDQQALYDQFHLDEPWDSPHNRTLVAKMPAVFRCPAEKRAFALDGKTRYLAPRGIATILRGAEPVSLRDITDGTSNTIIAIDAGDDHAVIWSKPDDWEFDPEPGIEGVFKSHAPGGINAIFADGSVRFLSETIAPATLRALSTRNGGEVIGPGDL